MIAGCSSGRTVPALARELAGRLSALFERDVEVVGRLVDAQRRLQSVNERLGRGLSPDALGLVYDGAAPAGQVLVALQQVHWTIHGAFHAYQYACEERRQLAVEVGEVAQQLTVVLCAVGWSAADARTVDGHKLARVGVG